MNAKSWKISRVVREHLEFKWKNLLHHCCLQVSIIRSKPRRLKFIEMLSSVKRDLLSVLAITARFVGPFNEIKELFWSLIQKFIQTFTKLQNSDKLISRWAVHAKLVRIHRIWLERSFRQLGWPICKFLQNLQHSILDGLGSSWQL